MCERKYCACREEREQRGGADPEMVRALEEEYEKFINTEGRSLVKKHLNREMFDRLKTRKTRFGSTLKDMIQSVLANPDSNVGLYAADTEAYDVFAELFNAVIKDYHYNFTERDWHPEPNWGFPGSLTNLDPEGKYVVSTRIRCARSIVGFPFNPSMSEKHYRELEAQVREALSSLEGELTGTYYPLGEMDKEMQDRLVDEHYLFKEGDRFLQAANANRFWPIGRGIFFNEAKTFLVWCNEEDHMRLISMASGGDVQSVYGRLHEGERRLAKKLKFARHPRLGYLSFCPTNLGTGIRGSVHIRLPNLNQDMAKFEEIASSYGLQVRGTAGEHTEGEGGVYDISNKRRLGISEIQIVAEMTSGIAKMIEMEESLAQSA